jgi:hypothetical protein
MAWPLLANASLATKRHTNALWSSVGPRHGVAVTRKWLSRNKTPHKRIASSVGLAMAWPLLANGSLATKRPTPHCGTHRKPRRASYFGNPAVTMSALCAISALWGTPYEQGMKLARAFTSHQPPHRAPPWQPASTNASLATSPRAELFCLKVRGFCSRKPLQP